MRIEREKRRERKRRSRWGPSDEEDGMGGANFSVPPPGVVPPQPGLGAVGFVPGAMAGTAGPSQTQNVTVIGPGELYIMKLLDKIYMVKWNVFCVVFLFRLTEWMDNETLHCFL